MINTLMKPKSFSQAQRDLINQENPAHHYALISVHGDPTAEIGQEGAGGQNIYVRELGLGLAQRGCQVDMFTRRENPNQPEIEELAPGCRTIRLTAGPREFIPRTELFKYLPAFVAAWLDFQSRSQCSYRLIHSNYWLSGWVGLQLKFHLGLPQVHTYHSLAAIKYRDLKNPPSIAAIRHGVEWACLEQCDCVVATSPQEAENLRQLLSAQGRIETVPCGINAAHFGSVSPEIARQKLNIDPEMPVILYVGRFDPRKGIETLVNACARLPAPWLLYLVGGSRSGGSDCQEQQRIRFLVKTLGLESRIIFTGRVSQTDLPSYYAATDVCVVPSYYEPFGLVAIEAMAAGTPVVASDVGGLRHTVVHNRTGLLVPPRNAEALATALGELLARPEKRQSMGRLGREWVESRFSSGAVARQILSLYQSLTLEKSAPEGVLPTQSLITALQKRIQQELGLKKGNKESELRHLAAMEKLIQVLQEGVKVSREQLYNF
ncbi:MULTISPECIES: glycosyltransferase [Microcystis]|uniref:Sucrose phosphate synthase n=2 Tax=Microcystis aeruginosa (strain PCC 7806) TaxID=267872 RepID=A8YP12_MICA7|nr:MULTISPECIES: glycosyltransferase [Microcystis]AFJ00072.1 sucrose phosphate synthase [Microcystis aeruginosa PCC 7806]ELS44976.1 glycosyl transferases group 1 family protein [Microcystis aeruginosa FACHB-905 = DIANCHI905]MDB9429932.1 glycosyltransferase [Microcystis aeruginosa CS-555/01A07]UGS08336.1 glycosyltransferase [Microcystis aeruginosa FACHB-905 = DIANCHI905]WKX63335.1 glycosyltransferase [Microcystis aeruginosa PCC 7806]